MIREGIATMAAVVLALEIDETKKSIPRLCYCFYGSADARPAAQILEQELFFKGQNIFEVENARQGSKKAPSIGNR